MPSLFPSFNPRQFKFSLWYFVVVMLAMTMLNQFFIKPQQSVINYSEFKTKIRDGDIKRVQISEKFYFGVPVEKEDFQSKAKTSIYKTVPVEDRSFIPLLDSMGIEYSARPAQNKFFANLFFGWIIPIAIMIFIWRLLFSRMGKMGQGIMSFTQNKAQLVAEGDVTTSFSDVAGTDEAKEELVEVVDFLKAPEKYNAIGGKIPKGVLLVGPPGGGKTLLARAVAGESKVTFFRMSGADFVEMFVGLGAARVRDLFKQAREKAPCIIFIDELDAIGKSRGNVAVGNDEREQTLNQLLVEMDGFDAKTGVIILAATNRPEVLDPALLRPGRFDRQVLVDRPDLEGREAILKIHSKGVQIDESVNLQIVARNTPGFVGADLANIVNEAALFAVRAGRKKVHQSDFEEAIEKVVAGLQKKNKLINPKEHEIVAYHETGHALVAGFTPEADPVQKISIVPRGMSALGYTMQLPTEDRYLATKNELLGKIDVLLGGRAAEQTIFGQVSTGAANDLVRATDIAKKMIREYGMSEKFSNVVLQARQGPGFLGNATDGGSRDYSEHTQQYIDEQLAETINGRYEHVLKLLAGKLELLKKIAARLLENETIDSKEFAAMAGLANTQSSK
jgi:cell division protease FtsH